MQVKYFITELSLENDIATQAQQIKYPDGNI